MEELVTAQSYFLVPLIRAHSSFLEQHKMNLFIVANLGILDSRILLCAMHDTAQEINEDNLFVKSVPFLARMMIPKWKRTLYEPRAKIKSKKLPSLSSEDSAAANTGEL